MCGFLPATALLFAARAAGRTAGRASSRGATAATRPGTLSSVVGYAGVIVDAT